MEKLTPLPTQVADAAFLVRKKRACLFSEPGTGKTLTALEAWKQVGGKLVVVAPPIALRMWQKNIEGHCEKKAQRIKTGKDKIDPTADAYVLSYSLAGKFDLAPDVLVLDEADALKTLNSARTKAIFGKNCNMMDCLACGVEHVWFLTGTPIRRYADDLYPVLRALFRDDLAKAGITSLEAFRGRFCVSQLRRFHPRQPATWTVIGNRDEAGLRDLIYGNELAVRRTIYDVAAHMPPLTVRTVSVDFENSDELREATGEAVYAGETDPIMAKARRLLGVAKAEAVAAYVYKTWLQLSCPVLVLYWHKDVGTALEERLKAEDLIVDKIDGATSAAEKERCEKAFNEKDSDVLLGQIASMGVAINLQEGSHYAVFAERDWSPAAQEQALRRLWRLGQKTHVHVDICEADHPIDEAVGMVVERKGKSATKIID
jgi:SWI/SNF-related matrix-associated actin-dependent regulator 1 of chromatin subfamily A